MKRYHILRFQCKFELMVYLHVRAIIWGATSKLFALMHHSSVASKRRNSEGNKNSHNLGYYFVKFRQYAA